MNVKILVRFLLVRGTAGKEPHSGWKTSCWFCRSKCASEKNTYYCHYKV